MARLRAAHSGPSLPPRERQLVAELAALGAGPPAAVLSEQRRRALEAELAGARAEKRAAVLAEDYDAAHAASQRERGLLEQLGGTAR
ncbi:unnamed protein product [Prorocentrum cordatum]|uniref:Uncharacterized protein n=1 Tax=Prorocentrum cordatum TaxID=2364126 RepID=A0ABN9Y648_9DINO|nr:unnamed protein product [Polarella glacialis]